MNKEEIKHFKSLLRQGSLRHMNILLDDKFQKELLTIIKDYEQLQQENKQLKDNWNKLKEWLKEYEEGTYGLGSYETGLSDGLGDVIKKMQELQGSDSDE